jgi:cytochrome b561
MDKFNRRDGAGATGERFQYDGAQRAFHWVMAVIILVAIAIGIYTAYLPPGTSPRRELLDLHKSLGMTAMVMIVLRIAYRLYRGEPRYREPPRRAAHLAAAGAHWLLYALMIYMPVTGYLNSGAGGYSLPWFGLFTWPRLIAIDKPVSALFELLHERGAWVIGALVLLHVAAVAWHRWVKRDEVLSRMAPISNRRG